jgi:hypothetical protein
MSGGEGLSGNVAIGGIEVGPLREDGATTPLSRDFSPIDARFEGLSGLRRVQPVTARSTANKQNPTRRSCSPDLTVLLRDKRCEPHGCRPPFLEEGKHMIRICLLSVFALASLLSVKAFAQGSEVAPIKVNLPPSPSFAASNLPTQYPGGEFSITGLRKMKDKYMDKDVQVKAYLVEIYECPAELRKCNDELNEKTKVQKKKAMKKGGEALTQNVQVDRGGCRPCDQPHFFMGDTPTVKKERALLIADYPIKDWETGDPKPLVAKTGEQYIVTGTFSINSMTGFAASNGLIIHKKFQDLQGKVLAEGNAVLPPEAQTINLEGKSAEKVGWEAHQKGGAAAGPKGDKSVPGGMKK